MAIDAPGDANVSISINWAETGTDIPEKAKKGLGELGGAAEKAGESVGGRLGSAFARLERREPTMAVRQLRVALDELILSTVGMTGPAGRLLATFAGLGLNGPLALISIGALAAAYRIATTDTRELEKAHTDLAKAINAANAAHAGRIGQFGQSLYGGGEAPSFWHLLISDNDPGGGMYSRRETVQQQLASSLELRGQQAAAGRNVGPTSELGKHIELLRHELASLNIAIRGSTEEQKRLRGIAEANARFEMWAADFRNPGILSGRAASLTGRRFDPFGQSFSSTRATDEIETYGFQRFGFGPRPQGQNLFERPGGPGLRPLGAPLSTDAAKLGQEAAQIILSMRTPVEILRKELETLEAAMKADATAADGAAKAHDRLKKRLEFEESQEKYGNVRIGVQAAFDAINQVRKGGISGILGGVGSLAESSTHLMDKDMLPLLGKYAGPVGIGAMVLSGLASLFSGGQAKVTVTDFEQQAISKLKTVRGDPLTRDIIVIAASDARGAMYDINRLAARGANPRTP